MPSVPSRLAIVALLALPLQPPAGIRGFAPDAARQQREWEGRFKAIPDPARQREYLRRLSARPHHVGSPYQKENSEYMRDLFRSWGWDADLAVYHVLFPTPRTRRLELVAPTKYVARLDEPVLKEDPGTNYKAEQLPGYNAFSGDGDVTGPLVYVNYGVPADYEELARRGISVKGAIV
ncbi:MAG: folate hydrolase, partial [Gemmatimonadetes bacterium]|nr:folate hydrolase [Gemmatimonadota bacterium]